jgi:LacI family transcriptional regulator
VSTSAVSLALNGHKGVSDETRAVILQVAHDLGYRANPLAKALRSGRSGSYALLIRNLSNPYFLDVISAAQGEAHQSAATMLVVDSGYASEREHVERLADANVDGLAIAPIGMGAAVLQWQRLRPGTPIVVLNAATAGLENVMRVSPDNESAVAQAVEHLAALGHRRVAFLTAPAKLMADHDRLTTFLAAAPALGLEPVPVESRLSLDAVEESTVSLLSSEHPPSAVITNSDHTASAVYRAAKSLGLQIGSDLSVVGHDDLPTSELLDPPLTTLSLDRRAIGRAMFDRLSGAARGNHLEAVHLVARASTGQAL